MRKSPSLPCNSLTIFCLLASACKVVHDPAIPWRLGVDIPDQQLEVVEPVDLVEVDSLLIVGLTTFDGGPRIEPGSDAAWWADDEFCGIARIELRTGQRTGQAGRCGAGPGEFQQVTSFAVVSDSVAILWDPTLQRLTRLPLRGSADTVAWPQPLIQPDGTRPTVTQIERAGPEEVVLTYGLRNGSSEPLDAWFDLSAGAITARRFPAPRETWRTLRQAASPTDSHYICESPFGFILASRWGHEFLAIGKDGTPLWSVFDAEATPPRTVDRGDATPGAQVQLSTWTRKPVCGERLAVLRTAKIPRPLLNIAFDLGGTFQVWDYEGRLRLDVDLSPGADSELLMGSAMWWNDALWFQDSETSIPTLRRFEVRPGSGRIIRFP